MTKKFKLFLSAILILLTASLFAADPLRSLSKKLQSDLKDKPVSLGVLNFTYDRGRLSTGSYLISERLLTYLVQDGATVIERRLLNSLLGEQRFAQIGITNIDSLKKAGKVLGVDAVVVGTLSDRPDGSATDVVARVIRVETAEVVAAGSAMTPQIWRDAPQFPGAARASVIVPEVSIGDPSSPVSHERNQAIRMSPETGRISLGSELPEYEPDEMDMSKRRHLVSNKPMRIQGYRPAPVPVFIPFPRRISQGGGSK